MIMQIGKTEASWAIDVISKCWKFPSVLIEMVVVITRTQDGKISKEFWTIEKHRNNLKTLWDRTPIFLPRINYPTFGQIWYFSISSYRLVNLYDQYDWIKKGVFASIFFENVSSVPFLSSLCFEACFQIEPSESLLPIPSIVPCIIQKNRIGEKEKANIDYITLPRRRLL